MSAASDRQAALAAKAALVGAPPPESQIEYELGIDNMEIFGHSQAGGSGARLPPIGGYALRLKRALGIRSAFDYSIGGAIACHPNTGGGGDGGFPWVLRRAIRPGAAGVTAAAGSPYTPASQLAIVHQGLNDLAQLGSAKPLPFQVALRTILARVCAGSIFEAGGGAAEAMSAQWAETGTWVAFGILDPTASSDGDGVRYTLTVGDKKTFTVPNDVPPGRVVHIGFWVNAAYGAVSIGVRLLRGGNPVGNPAPIAYTGTAITDQAVANMHIVHTVRFGTGDQSNANDPLGGITLQPGDQIELTLSSGTGMAPDFAGVEADPYDGPLLICPLPSKPATYEIWGSWAGGASMNDAVIDQWKGIERAVLAEFPNRVFSDSGGLGLDFDLVSGANRYTVAPGHAPAPAGVEGHWASDGAHPVELLYSLWAEYAMKWIRRSPLLSDRIRTRPTIDPRPRAFKRVSAHNSAGAFSTGWSNFNVGSGPWTLPFCEWRMDENRRVYVRATLKAAAGAGLPILPANTLPKPSVSKDGIVAQQFDGVSAWSTRQLRLGADGSLALLGGGAVVTTAGNAVSFEFDYMAEL